MAETPLVHRCGGSGHIGPGHIWARSAMCDPKIIDHLDTIAFTDGRVSCPACHEAMKAANVAAALTGGAARVYWVPEDLDA